MARRPDNRQWFIERKLHEWADWSASPDAHIKWLSHVWAKIVAAQTGKKAESISSTRIGLAVRRNIAADRAAIVSHSPDVVPAVNTRDMLLEAFIPESDISALRKAVGDQRAEKLMHFLAAKYVEVLERYLQLNERKPAAQVLDLMVEQIHFLITELTQKVTEKGKDKKGDYLSHPQVHELARIALSFIINLGLLDTKPGPGQIAKILQNITKRDTAKPSDLTDSRHWQLMEFFYDLDSSIWLPLLGKLVSGYTQIAEGNVHIYSQAELDEIIGLTDTLLFFLRAQTISRGATIGFDENNEAKGLEPLANAIPNARKVETRDNAVLSDVGNDERGEVTKRVFRYMNLINTAGLEVVLSLFGGTEAFTALDKVAVRSGDRVGLLNFAELNALHSMLPVSDMPAVSLSESIPTRDEIRKAAKNHVVTIGLLSPQTVRRRKKDQRRTELFVPLAYSVPEAIEVIDKKANKDGEQVETDARTNRVRFRKFSTEETDAMAGNNGFTKLPDIETLHKRGREEAVSGLTTHFLRQLLSGNLRVDTQIDQVLTASALALLVEPDGNVFILNSAVRLQMERMIFPVLKKALLMANNRVNEGLLRFVDLIMPLWSSESKTAFLKYLSTEDRRYPNYIASGIWGHVAKVCGVYDQSVHLRKSGKDEEFASVVSNEAVEIFNKFRYANGRFAAAADLIHELAQLQHPTTKPRLPYWEKPARGEVFPSSLVQDRIEAGAHPVVVGVIDTVAFVGGDDGLAKLTPVITKAWKNFVRIQLDASIPTDFTKIIDLRGRAAKEVIEKRETELQQSLVALRLKLQAALKHQSAETEHAVFYKEQLAELDKLEKDLVTEMRAKASENGESHSVKPSLDIPSLLQAVLARSASVDVMGPFMTKMDLPPSDSASIIQQLREAGLLEGVVADIKAAALDTNQFNEVAAKIYPKLLLVRASITEAQIKYGLSHAIQEHNTIAGLQAKLQSIQTEMLEAQVTALATAHMNQTTLDAAFDTWLQRLTDPRNTINSTRGDLLATLEELGFKDVSEIAPKVDVETLQAYVLRD